MRYRLESASWYLWQGPQAVSLGTFVVGGTAGDPAVSGSGVVRPLVTQTTDRWGNVLTLTDPRHAGWVTSYTYNQNNQLVLESRPDGTSQAVYYDALGRQVATRDGPRGGAGGTWSVDSAGSFIVELGRWNLPRVPSEKSISSSMASSFGVLMAPMPQTASARHAQ